MKKLLTSSKSFVSLMSTINFSFLRLDHFIQLLDTSSVIIGLELVFSDLCLTVSDNLLSLVLQNNPDWMYGSVASEMWCGFVDDVGHCVVSAAGLLHGRPRRGHRVDNWGHCMFWARKRNGMLRWWSVCLCGLLQQGVESVRATQVGQEVLAVCHDFSGAVLYRRALAVAEGVRTAAGRTESLLEWSTGSLMPKPSLFDGHLRTEP